jgi:hypothetical protein
MSRDEKDEDFTLPENRPNCKPIFRVPTLQRQPMRAIAVCGTHNNDPGTWSRRHVIRCQIKMTVIYSHATAAQSTSFDYLMP